MVTTRTERDLDGVRRLFELSLDLLFIARADGFFAMVNPAFTRALGYSEQEVLASSFVEFVHPDDADRTVREIERLNTGVPTVQFENRFRKRDGGYAWISWSASASASARTAESGEIYVVGRDVTRRRVIEETLAVSERTAQRLARENELLAAIGRAGTSETAMRTTFPAVLRKASELVPFDEMTVSIARGDRLEVRFTSRTVFPDIELPIDAPLEGTVQAEALRTGAAVRYCVTSLEDLVQRYPFEVPSYKRGVRSVLVVPMAVDYDCPVFLGLISNRTEPYSDDEVAGAVRIGEQLSGPVGTDLLFSDLAQSRQKLQASEDAYRCLFDEAPVGYHELDSAGYVTRVNSTELRMRGYVESEMVGQHISKLAFDPETARRDFERRANVEHPEAESVERNVPRKDGTTFPALVTAIPTSDEHGEFSGFRVSIQNVSRLKAVEQELRVAAQRRAELETLNKTTRAMGHHIRNAVTPALVMADSIDPADPDQSRAFRRVVGEGALRAAAVVDALDEVCRLGVISVTRMVAGDAREMLDLDELIERFSKQRRTEWSPE